MMRKVLSATWIPWLWVVVSLSACDGDDGDPCVPGAERDCSCEDGAAGEQVCRSTGWSRCVCEAGGDADIDGDADGDLDGEADGDADIDGDGDMDSVVECRGDRPQLCERDGLSVCAAADADCVTLAACNGETLVCELGEEVVCPPSGAPRCEPRAGWAVVRPGTFTMGSPAGEELRRENETLHELTLTRPFMIQTTEVTQEQFEAVLGVNPSLFPECGASCAVDNLSWADAVGYCNALSRAEGIEECYEDCSCRLRDEYETPYDCPGYRLPTEAEWEHAARAGSTAARYGPLDEIAWHEGNSEEMPHEVGLLTSNEWGLYDMLGNVSEWCSDKYAFDLGPDEVVDPVTLEGLSDRVVRGGCFLHGDDRIRAAYRTSSQAALPLPGAGLRPVRSLP